MADLLERCGKQTAYPAGAREQGFEADTLGMAFVAQRTLTLRAPETAGDNLLAPGTVTVPDGALLERFASARDLA
jgi:hypothetical protein